MYLALLLWGVGGTAPGGERGPIEGSPARMVCRCEGGTTLQVVFSQEAATISVNGQQAMTLPASPAGSGFLYKDVRHALRGKADEVTWTIEGSSPVSCRVVDPESARLESKIGFDHNAIQDDGLVGPLDGLRALSYEFCIPREDRYRDEVRSIDPTIRVYASAPGRIGCTGEEWLCIGHTHQPGFREILLRLAALSYVEQIREAHFE